MIYDRLFFHAYNISSKSKSNKDMPIFWPLMVVMACFIFNIYTLFFLLDGLQVMTTPDTEGLEWFLVLLILGLLALYFLWNKKYKKIATSRPFPKRWQSALFIAAFFIISFLLALLAGMYKNHDGVFR
jgi:uncharacterized membrane protein YfcA